MRTNRAITGNYLYTVVADNPSTNYHFGWTGSSTPTTYPQIFAQAISLIIKKISTLWVSKGVNPYSYV